jgi:hypothetical protein
MPSRRWNVSLHQKSTKQCCQGLAAVNPTTGEPKATSTHPGLLYAPAFGSRSSLSHQSYNHGMKKWMLPLGIFVVLGAVYWLWPRHDFKMPPPSELQAVFPGRSRQILENSQQFTLISLAPLPYFEPKAKDYWHGFRVLGQTVVTNQDQRADLIAALYDSMAGEGATKACFSPRHGIRAVRDGNPIDLVICFSCGLMKVYTPYGQAEGGVTKPSQKYFDRALRQAGVELPNR